MASILLLEVLYDFIASTHHADFTKVKVVRGVGYSRGTTQSMGWGIRLPNQQDHKNCLQNFHTK
jgi:hypothetical protein